MPQCLMKLLPASFPPDVAIHVIQTLGISSAPFLNSYPGQQQQPETTEIQVQLGLGWNGDQISTAVVTTTKAQIRVLQN